MPPKGGTKSSSTAAATPQPAARVFTIPPGEPFLPALARAVLTGQLPKPGGQPPDPLDLPEITLLLPTRRAARALQEAFREASGKSAVLLPKIRPIATADEDLMLLSGLVDAAETPAAIPPAISELERRLVLTQLVLKWAQTIAVYDDDPLAPPPYVGAGMNTPAQAASLAKELGRFIDMVETEGAELSKLHELVPDTFSEHWQKTLRFLEIIVDWWPEYLRERGLLSPMERRNRLIRAEAQRLIANPPSGPVIVAGVTGSIPATAELMQVVLSLENGAIVLPGLDQMLDDAGWAAVHAHPEHPQHGLAKLLSRLNVPREAVRPLPNLATHKAKSARARLISEALRPASTTDAWSAFVAKADRDTIRSALDGVSLIEAPTAQDEAEVIALILREALETPDRTAALITPDRTLARRVAHRLEHWHILVDDSAGKPLRKTPPGALLDLVVEAFARDFEPAAVMALLKHPLTQLGLPAGDARKAARALELIAFRTDYLGRGLDGIELAIERASAQIAARMRRHQAITRLRDADWNAARDLLNRLKSAYQPLLDLAARPGDQPLADFVRAHVEVAEELARLSEEDAAPRSPLWQGDAGEAAAALFTGLLDPTLSAPAVSARDYPDFYRSLASDVNVRQAHPTHPRLFIWGPFEARLQCPDVVVIGGLNEGTWPETSDTGPWVNRPMRTQIGLPQPEEHIGYAAHDFSQLLGVPTVYLTRAEKVDGAPTVPSRWLLRIKALLDGLGLRDALAPDRPWLGWARAKELTEPVPRIAAPSPCPAVELRPRRLSVSDIERWITNPYAIFARHILRLEPLPLLGAEPGAALRGAIVHEALRRFAKDHPEQVPENAAAALLALADQILTEYTGNPRIAAFWVPRLERFARWFASTEPGRREGVARVLAEVSGSYVLSGPAGPFTLTARADRVDVCPDGLVITDYKTGSKNSIERLAKRAREGLAPQLPLEALIAANGGFAGVQDTRIAKLRYISASGGEPPGSEVTIDQEVEAIIEATRKGLERLIATFDNPSTPYRAVRRPSYDYRYDDYKHLARVSEWIGAEAEGGGDE